MLSKLLAYLIANLSAMEYFERVDGLASMIYEADGKKFVGLYENGEVVNVNFDTCKSILFFLLDGDVQRETRDNEFIACKYLVNETYNLKCIVYSQGKEDVNCASMSQRLAGMVSKAITGKHLSLMNDTGLDWVMMQTTATIIDRQQVWNELYSAKSALKDTDYLVMVKMKITIEGDQACYVPYPCDVVAVQAGEDESIIQTQNGSFIQA